MSRMAEQQLYINGGYTSATSGRTFETINPATGEVLATVQAAGREDVDRAVESAQRGQKIWAAMTAMERSRILRRAVDLLRQRNDELARLETLDTGKPLSETAAVDIVTGADVLEYYAGLIPALEGSQIPLRDSSFVYTRREPLGVVAGIGAWNYPIQIALWKSAPALAAAQNAPSLEAECETRADAGLARECIEGLAEPYRTVSVLYFMQEWPVEAIARQLGRMPKTVHTQLYRAKKMLRRELAAVG